MVDRLQHEDTGSGQDAVAEAERLLRQGEPLLAYNVADAALAIEPGHVRLRQLQALALARSGDLERASRILGELVDAGLDDAETLGVLARTIYKPFGFLTDAQWRRLTETSTRRLPDGRVTPHYDPAMVQQFESHPDDYERWAEWDRLDVPVLCLRGEHSDLLLAETAEAMRKRGPRAVVATIEGCGHAPALNVSDQWALVERFLAA